MFAKISGVVVVEGFPGPSHYHEGKIYNVVKVSSTRSGTNPKKDFLRIYFDPGKFPKEMFVPGLGIKYEGEIIKSKIAPSLSDISVSATTIEVLSTDEIYANAKLNNDKVKTGSVLSLKGKIVKINPESVTESLRSISFLVMNENELGKRVIVKFTAIGKLVDYVKTLEKDDLVSISAKVYSYQIKNRLDLEECHLHDNRVMSIVKVKGDVGEQ